MAKDKRRVTNGINHEGTDKLFRDTVILWLSYLIPLPAPSPQSQGSVVEIERARTPDPERARLPTPTFQ